MRSLCLSPKLERKQFAESYLPEVPVNVLSREEGVLSGEEGVRTLGVAWAPGTSFSLHPSALRPQVLRALFHSELFRMWLIFLLKLLGICLLFKNTF